MASNCLNTRRFNKVNIEKLKPSHDNECKSYKILEEFENL